jgi:Flp pilus assembly protein TadG
MVYIQLLATSRRCGLAPVAGLGRNLLPCLSTDAARAVVKQERQMQVVQTLKQKFKSFAACQNGAMGIIFALGALPLFAAVGAAVDYGRQVDAKSHITSALDAAALAGAAAAGSSEKQREKIAQDTFKANMMANMADGKNVEAVFVGDR